MKVFVSSVQNELAEERRAVKTFIERDPLLRRLLEAETLWLNQKQLTVLFGKAKGTISGPRLLM